MIWNRKFMKYTKEILDFALFNLKNSDVKERKKAATVFMKAACAELGTKNTKPVKEWFVLNIDDYLTSIKKETDNEILWINIYTLQQFCDRYINSAYLFKIRRERAYAFCRNFFRFYPGFLCLRKK